MHFITPKAQHLNRVIDAKNSREILIKLNKPFWIDRVDPIWQYRTDSFLIDLQQNPNGFTRAGTTSFGDR